MEESKSFLQIGENHGNKKIYVEDYVVSFLKQKNGYGAYGGIGMALYGTIKKDNEDTFYFIYGACELKKLRQDTKYLSAAQRQEIEKLGLQYFRTYQFLGYCILTGDFISGIYLEDKNQCTFVDGYTLFYEKNEAMLNYMMENRKNMTPSEDISYEKYDKAKEKAQERKLQYMNQQEKSRRTGFSDKAVTAAAVFAILAVGLYLGKDELGGFLKQAQLDILEKKLPAVQQIEPIDKIALETEEALTDFQLEELQNKIQQVQSTVVIQTTGEETERTNEGWQELKGESGQSVNEGAANIEVDNVEADNGETRNIEAGNEEALNGEAENGDSESGDSENENEDSESGDSVNVNSVEVDIIDSSVDAAEELEPEGQFYVLKRGDTLSKLAYAYYGNGKYISRICEINGIDNPDDIKAGDKIFLP